MKKINNELFQDLHLKNSEIVKISGGSSTITSVDSDSNLSSGAGYDISFQTLNGSGQKTGIDHTPTGITDLDKPGPCNPKILSIQQ